ncbi:MAG TPA: J domain-containing protein [Candidatus Limnocylindrales bacterium]|nr:J domain-containing protein [Candidatus Limnocylindrales bacterium]
MTADFDEDLLSPEGQELSRKRAQLKRLEDTLIEQEDRLAIRRSEVASFERMYLREIGSRYERRDELLAELEELRAAAAGETVADGEGAAARRAARPPSEETALTASEEEQAERQDDPRLRELYRKLARRVHPDLADGEEERQRRHAVMAEVNMAYERGDMEALQLLLASEVHAPEAIQGDGIAAELVRVIRRVHRVEGGLRKVARGLRTLAHSEIGRLFAEVEAARTQGQDLLGDLAARLDGEIAQLGEELHALQDRLAR